MAIDTQGSLSSMAQLSLKLNPGRYGTDFTSITDPEKRAALSNQMVSRIGQYTSMINQAQSNRLRMADMAMRQQAFVKQQESETTAQALSMELTDRINKAPTEDWGKIITETIAKSPNHTVANQLTQLGNTISQGSQYQQFSKLQQQEQHLKGAIAIKEATDVLQLQEAAFSVGLDPKVYTDEQTGKLNRAALAKDVSIRKREEKITDDTREFNQSEALLDKRLENQRGIAEASNTTRMDVAKIREDLTKTKGESKAQTKDLLEHNKLENKLAELKAKLPTAKKHPLKSSKEKSQGELQQDIAGIEASLKTVKDRLGVGEEEAAAPAAPKAVPAAELTPQGVKEAVAKRGQPAEGNRKAGLKYRLNAKTEGIYLGGPIDSIDSYLVVE